MQHVADQHPPTEHPRADGPRFGTSLVHKAIGAARSTAFVYLVALIMTVGAERMFWFWEPSLRVQLEVAAFYTIATAPCLALMRRFGVSSWWSLALVAPIAAFIVEGVITPVVYSGGPFVPIFPAWFTFWHGLFALMGLVFGIRRLLLREAIVPLAATAVGLGVFWAMWSATLRLPENVNDVELIEASGGPLEVLDPAAFTTYAFVMTAVFIVGHALLGFVWPKVAPGAEAPDWLARTGRMTIAERVMLGLLLLGAGGWTIVLPWALPMFVLHCWLQIKGLRWHRARVLADPAQHTSTFEQLSGRVRLRALAPLALMAPAAAGGYALLWELDPSEESIRVFMYSTIAVQGIIGFVVAVKSLVMARRAARDVSSSSSASSTSRRALSPSG